MSAVRAVRAQPEQRRAPVGSDDVSPRRLSHRLFRVGVAILSGVALGLAFPPVGWVLLMPGAVLALSACTRHQSPRLGAGCGFGFGMAFMLVLMPWMRVIGSDAWIALAVVQALFYAVLGAALALIFRLAWWPLWTACCWVGAELLRGTVPFGGLPWGRLAFGLDETPLAGWARYVGAAGVTGVLVLAAALTLWAVLPERRHRVTSAMLALAGVVALVGVGALLPVGTAGAGDQQRVVAAVQGGAPGSGLDAFAEERVVLRNHVVATQRLARRAEGGAVPVPDLVLWPENSSDIDPFRDPTAAAAIGRAVRAVGAPTLVGSVVETDDGDNLRNMGIVWSPGQGVTDSYAKRRLVPFGEYVPLRSLLEPWIGRLSMIPRDFVPGNEPGVVRMADVAVGAVTCFEVAYGDAVRDVVNAGAELIVVQTNNATYLGTGQLEQQWAISRLRAIESGRPVVVAATSGISGIVLPDGRVVDRTASSEPEVLVARVPLAAVSTAGIVVGGWVEAVAGMLAVVAVGIAVVRRRSSGQVG